MAVLSAWVLNKSIKAKAKSTFVIEMPGYKMPLFKNVFINVVEKTKAFVTGAGQIILAISIILWVLASYGPGEQFANAEEIITERYSNTEVFENGETLESKISGHKLEHSYIGYLGKAIEPIVQPLGYDWKIGIAIISSFAAREVFVGTLATIYSVGNEEEETIKNKMAAEINPVTGKALFNFATGISLLLFYAFAMQCVSTVAVVKKETNGWKWPSIQLVSMSIIAYVSALIAYQFLK